MEKTEDKLHQEKFPWLVFFTSDDDIHSNNSSDEDSDQSSQVSEEHQCDEETNNKLSPTSCDDEKEISESSKEGEDEEEEEVQLLPKFYSLANNEFFPNPTSEIIQGQCLASPQGWLFIHNPIHSLCFLLNPTTSQKVHLPFLELEHPIDYIEHKLLLSSSPAESDHDCVVMFASYNEDRLHFCRIKADNAWTSLHYPDTLGDSEILSDVAVSDGKFYGLTLQLNIALIETAPVYKITLIKMQNNTELHSPVGSTGPSWLIESGQELFLVMRFLSYGSRRVVDLKVYKMGLDEEIWNRAESIDETIFITSGMFGVSWQESDDVGLKGGCVYYMQDGGSRIGCFDLKHGSISFYQPCLKSCFTPLCILPPI